MGREDRNEVIQQKQKKARLISSQDRAKALDSTWIRDMRKMLHDPSLTDMVFVCSDGVEIPALRKLVAAHSPVLHSMLLTSGMSEATLTRVPLPTFKSSAIRVCVEFLNTGLVQSDILPGRMHDCMEVASAARFLLIPELENRIVCKCMGMSTRSSRDFLQAYNLATELYHDQPGQNLASLVNSWGHKTAMLLTRYSVCHKPLSERGCLHLLATILSSADPLRHYHLLLHAIHWCASRRFDSSDAVQKALDRILPWSLQDKLPMLELKDADKVPSTDVVTSVCIKLLAEPLECLLKKTSFDLSKVSPIIVTRVLEPLGILSSSRLLAAYRSRAIFEPELKWDTYGLPSSYKISKNSSCEIKGSSMDARSGYARCNALPSCFVFFEWEVNILKLCDKLIVGYCHAGSSVSSSSRWLGEETGSVALVLKGNFGFEDERPSFVQSASKMGASIKKYSKIRVLVNLARSVCIFKVDRQKVWETKIHGGSTKDICPSISMQRPGRVQVKVLLCV